MVVTVNGQDKEMSEPASITDLLDSLGLAGLPVVVQRNGDILERTCFQNTRLADGDRLELIRLVGGG